MADQHNANIPQLGNTLAADIVDIKENLEWHKDVLQMVLGWKDSTIGSVGPLPHRSAFAYSDADTITIGAGSYFHDGTTRQVVFWDAAITFDCESGGSNAGSTDFGTSEWHYIYLDDSAIVTQASPELDADCFLNSTTAPTFSTTKHGWYNGVDKCIFAFYVGSAGTIYEFFHDSGGFVFFADDINDFNNQAVGATFTDATLTMPAFSIGAIVTFYLYFNDGVGRTAYWRTNGQVGSGGHIIDTVDSSSITVFNQVRVVTDSSQKIEVKFISATNQTITVYTNGWFFPSTV